MGEMEVRGCKKWLRGGEVCSSGEGEYVVMGGWKGMWRWQGGEI